MRALLTIYELIIFPVEFLGWAWYMLVETPLYRGRMRGFEHLSKSYNKVDNEK